MTDQLHSKGTPFYPMQEYNGSLTRKANRQAPSTDVDNSGREFRRFVNASGAQDVQIYNGLQRGIGQGRRIPWVTYLYAAQPRIPGQHRDDYGGKIRKPLDPNTFQNAFNNGPGAQDSNPGGPRQMGGSYIYNPGTS